MNSKRVVVGGVLLVVLLIPDLILGQYFGRNKVKYETFNFQVLETENFEIYHYPREFQAIKDLGQLAERWYDRHTVTFHHHFEFKNPLIIYANHADFQQTNVIRSQLSVATGGVTEGRRNRIVMPFAETNASTNHVLGHELVHAFQYDVARQSKVGSIRATSRLPTWFIEGMAEYLAIGSHDTHTAMWMRDAVLHDDVPTIKQVSNSREYFPYRYGHSIWSFIAGKWGDQKVQPLYRQALQTSVKNSFKQVLGVSRDSASTLWRQSIINRYEPMVKKRDKPSEIGQKLLAPSNNSGSRNLSPSLSPDGEYVAYISDRSLFSLELFIANANTGKVIKKLTSTMTTPHLNALRFVQSSGTWGPESERFAYVIFAKGDNQLAITDVESGEIIQRKKFGKIGSITNPSWSPDGNKIAFSGSVGGYSNLFVYNLETDSLKQLTDDKYSDLQPTWSPSGDRIAFVSDRGAGTDFQKLTFGPMKISVYDLSTGNIEVIEGFDNYKHINPQFGPQGENLYFVSDYRGFSNVYRYNMVRRNYYRITNISTGVSGISSLSPAMTVARETGDMVVTVFDEQRYIGYKIEESERKGRLVKRESRDMASGWLPPAGEGHQYVMSYINTPDDPEYSEDGFSLHDYRARLKLSYLGGMGRLGVSTNQYESRVAGGITAQFSDVLNHHTLYSTLNARGTFKEFGGEVGYLNKKHRIYWGGSISHLPFNTSSAFVSIDTLSTREGDEIPVNVINRLQRHIFQDRLNLQAIYPFSRNLRLESNLSYSHIWSDLELETTTTTLGGQVLDRETRSLESPEPVNLYGGSLALVGDNSLSAFTGPIKGHRFRFEAEPTVGAQEFVSIRADYRRYLFMDPFTIAFRGMHLGRYAGGESNRLTPYSLGFERLIHGYSLGSYALTKCQQPNTRTGGCAGLNNLAGSRIGVFNTEFRIPLFGADQLSLYETSILPTTVSAFFDGGVAWTSDESPNIEWAQNLSDRVPVFSTGLSTRVNILGYLITEFYLAYPFQRENQQPHFGFQFSPGW